MITTQIKRLAEKNGIKTAYQLQKAATLSPSMAARLYRDEVEMISLKTLENLCAALKCSPNELFGFDESSKALTQASNTDSSNIETLIDASADSVVWLSTGEVAARLGINPRAVRKMIERRELPATKRQTPQGFSNFIIESDLSADSNSKK